MERDSQTHQPKRLAVRYLLSADDRGALVRDYLDGTPTTQLTQRYGLGKSTVLEILQTEGVKMRRQPLTDEQITTAAELYAAGKSLAKVADVLGSAPTTVGRALRADGVQLRPGPGRSPASRQRVRATGGRSRVPSD